MNHPEHKEQARFFRALREADTPAARFTFAVPNGARMVSVKHAQLVKAEGMKSGVPDVICPVPNPHTQKCGLAIEMKIPPNKSTPEQVKWQEYLRSVGWEVCECHSAEEAFDVFANYTDMPAHLEQYIKAGILPYA